MINDRREEERTHKFYLWATQLLLPPFQSEQQQYPALAVI